MSDSRTRYAVTIEFEHDEPYKNHVTAQDRFSAFRLALQDSRMGSQFGSFYSPVKAWDAVIDEEALAL